MEQGPCQSSLQDLVAIYGSQARAGTGFCPSEGTLEVFVRGRRERQKVIDIDVACPIDLLGVGE